MQANYHAFDIDPDLSLINAKIESQDKSEKKFKNQKNKQNNTDQILQKSISFVRYCTLYWITY